jgi:hypothetical protein
MQTVEPQLIAAKPLIVNYTFRTGTQVRSESLVMVESFSMVALGFLVSSTNVIACLFALWAGWLAGWHSVPITGSSAPPS